MVSKAQKALTIHPKVAGSGIGLYLAVISLYLADRLGEVPPETVQDAIIGTFVLVFGWLAPSTAAGGE